VCEQVVDLLLCCLGMISDEVLTHELNANVLEVECDLETSRDGERWIGHITFYVDTATQTAHGSPKESVP
jgi:hypothetical protein